MRTDQIARNIAKHLQTSIDVEAVVHPDHPFLFDSPDLLVAQPGNLVGVFILRVTESKSSDLLFSRLAVSRLALPHNFRCILVIPQKLLNKVNFTQAENQFHEVLPDNDLRNLTSFISDKVAKGNILNIPDEEKSRTFERFNLFFSESLKSVEFEHKDKTKQNKTDSTETKSAKKKELIDYIEREFKPTKINRWKLLNYPQGKEITSNRLLHDEDKIVGITSDRSTNTLNEKIKPLCRDILQWSYVMDRGVPYLKEQTSNLLLANDLPITQYDSEKPARVAAFAGWVMSSNENFDYINQKLHEISKITKKMKFK